MNIQQIETDPDPYAPRLNRDQQPGIDARCGTGRNRLGAAGGQHEAAVQRKRKGTLRRKPAQREAAVRARPNAHAAPPR